MATELDEPTASEAAWRRSAREIPAVAWLLVAVAAIDIGSLTVSRGLFSAQPLRIGQLVHVLMSATPFLLAAGVVVGARHWPAARVWLITAAVALVLWGLLQGVLDVWLYVVEASPTPPDPSWEWILAPRDFLAAALSVMAPVLLAVGLWVAPRPSAPRSRNQRLAIGALLAIGLAATAGALASTEIQGGRPITMPPDVWALVVITALVAPAFTALGLSAALRTSKAEWLPGLLIAAGAGLVAAASGWLGWLFTLHMIQDIPADLIGGLLVLPNGLVVVGLLGVAAGFAIGGLSEQRPSAA